jgi:hypothetical protein
MISVDHIAGHLVCRSDCHEVALVIDATDVCHDSAGVVASLEALGCGACVQGPDLLIQPVDDGLLEFNGEGTVAGLLVEAFASNRTLAPMILPNEDPLDGWAGADWAE